MSQDRPSRHTRQNALAQSLGYRNYYERRQDREYLRNNGFALSEHANRRAFGGFLRSMGKQFDLASGVVPSGRMAAPTKPVMEAFIDLVLEKRLNRAPGGTPVTEFIEGQDWYDPEDDNWDEWFDNYTGEEE